MDITVIIAWIVILILAWVFIKPYVLTFVISKKNRAGIPTNLGPEQILTLLERYPWCENQDARAEAADIPGTQLKSQIRLNGICSEFYLYTKDGLLHGHGFTTRKVEKLRRLYLVQKETQRLLQYITCQADPHAPENEAAAQLREENKKAILRRDRYDKLDNFCYLLAALAVIVLVVLHFIPFKDYSPSANVKGTVFTDFHYTKTIGAALASFDPDGEWYDISEKNALKENGVAYAGWRGTCLMSSLLSESTNQPIELDFEVELTDRDEIYVSLDKIYFMDQYYFSSSNTYQGIVIADILNMIYGNSQYAEVTLDTGMIDLTYWVQAKDTSIPAAQDHNTNNQANVSDGNENIPNDNVDTDEQMSISYQCDFDSGDYAVITITHHAEITDSDNQFIAADYVLGSTNKVLIHLEGYATTISDTEYILDDPSGVSLDIERLNFDELVVTTSGENLHGITFAGEYYAF